MFFEDWILNVLKIVSCTKTIYSLMKFLYNKIINDISNKIVEKMKCMKNES